MLLNVANNIAVDDRGIISQVGIAWQRAQVANTKPEQQETAVALLCFAVCMIYAGLFFPIRCPLFVRNKENNARFCSC